MNKLTSTLITTVALALGATSASADSSLFLTKPNGHSSSGGCSTNTLSLTQSNVCNNTITIKNATDHGIYYDLGSNEDEYIQAGGSVTWTLKSNADRGRSLVFDYDLYTPGIQYRKYHVTTGTNIVFRRRGGKLDAYSTK